MKVYTVSEHQHGTITAFATRRGVDEYVEDRDLTDEHTSLSVMEVPVSKESIIAMAGTHGGYATSVKIIPLRRSSNDG